MQFTESLIEMQNNLIFDCRKRKNSNVFSIFVFKQGQRSIIAIIIFSQIKIGMPKLRIQQEDEDYAQEEPTTYRKYSRKTKIKYCYLVKKLGWKASSAAKLLKIKGSTAKMILKNFKHPNLDQVSENISQPENKLKSNSQKQANTTQNKIQSTTDTKYPDICWIFYGPNPFFLYPVPNKQNNQ